MLKKTGQLKDYIIYGSGQVLNLIAPLLIAPHIIAVSGMENWGRIGVALSVFSLLGIFIDFGSLLIGVKELSINKNDAVKIKQQLDEVYTFRAIVFVVLTLLVVCAIGIFKLDHKLYLCGIAMLLGQLLNPLWIYQAFEEFAVINRIVILSKGIYLIAVYVFITKAESYPYMLMYFGGANAVIYGFFLMKLSKKYGMALFSVPITKLRDNFNKEYPIVISNFSIAAYTFGPILIVGHIGGEYLAGIYHVGDMLLKIIRSYLSVFFNVSFPKFCTAYSADKRRGMAFLKTINKIHWALIVSGLVIAYTGVLLLIDRLAISKEMHDGILFCVRFLGIGIIVAINIPFYQLLIYYNKQKEVSAISACGAFIMLISCYFLTSMFSLNGSIVSLYIVECFITASIIVMCFRKVLANRLQS